MRGGDACPEGASARKKAAAPRKRPWRFELTPQRAKASPLRRFGRFLIWRWRQQTSGAQRGNIRNTNVRNPRRKKTRSHETRVRGVDPKSFFGASQTPRATPYRKRPFPRNDFRAGRPGRPRRTERCAPSPQGRAEVFRAFFCFPR